MEEHRLSLAGSAKVPPWGELCLHSSSTGGEGKPRAYMVLIQWVTC